MVIQETLNRHSRLYLYILNISIPTHVYASLAKIIKEKAVTNLKGSKDGSWD